jgi:ATP synthase protein I
MPSHDAQILRGAALIAGPVGLVAAAVSGGVAGVRGLVGALVALAVVFVFFGVGLAVLVRLTRDRPQLLMTAGLLVYAVQILFAGVFLVVFKNTTLFNGRAFGFSLLATALAWVGGQVYRTLRSNTLYVDPALGAPPGSKAESRR